MQPLNPLSPSIVIRPIPDTDSASRRLPPHVTRTPPAPYHRDTKKATLGQGRATSEGEQEKENGMKTLCLSLMAGLFVVPANPPTQKLWDWQQAQEVKALRDIANELQNLNHANKLRELNSRQGARPSRTDGLLVAIVLRLANSTTTLANHRDQIVREIKRLGEHVRAIEENPVLKELEALRAAIVQADKVISQYQKKAKDADRQLRKLRSWNAERGQLITRIDALERRVKELQARKP